jgi:RNA polymerase sigma factor (sigma-70 family)
MSNDAPRHQRDTFPASGVGRSDARLVAACRRGDETAWDELVDRYQRLIYAVPKRAGLDDDQCADVFQEVFVTLLEKLGSIEQPEKIRSWIVTTSKFKTWGLIRSKKGFSNPADEEEMELEMERIADSAPLADQVLLELEQQHLIRTAMLELDERCRTIIAMLYVRTDAASYAEVAEAIGVEATGISPMRSRCLKKLERILSR